MTTQQQRGRPRIDPQLRFRDVMPYWTIAHDRATITPQDKALFICQLPTENKAINIMHRLNMARAAMRDHGISDFDAYVVRRFGKQVSIHHRAVIETNNIFDGDGNPIDPKVVQAAIWTDLTNKKPIITDEDIRRFSKPGDPNSAVEKQIAAMHETRKRELDRDYEPPVREHLHEIDPNKPLLDE
jgi:hypothetical protein